jgi:hypothetical protein
MVEFFHGDKWHLRLLTLIVATACVTYYLVSTSCIIGRAHLAASLSPLTPASVRLFIGILSASDNTDKRAAIRSTWGRDPKIERAVFIISRPRTLESLDAIRKEALRFKDIIFLGQMIEGYHNITRQTLEVFRAAYAYHGPVTHVLKCDDDSYVHVDRMIMFLAGLPRHLTWTGLMHQGYYPDRNPSVKWYVPESEMRDQYLNISWSNGPGYVITIDLAIQLATGAVEKCMPGAMFKLEDIALGMWLTCLQREQNLNMTTVGTQKINVGGCNHDDLVSHRITPRQARCMFARNGLCCPSF